MHGLRHCKHFTAPRCTHVKLLQKIARLQNTLHESKKLYQIGFLKVLFINISFPGPPETLFGPFFLVGRKFKRYRTSNRNYFPNRVKKYNTVYNYKFNSTSKPTRVTSKLSCAVCRSVALSTVRVYSQALFCFHSMAVWNIKLNDSKLSCENIIFTK